MSATDRSQTAALHVSQGSAGVAEDTLLIESRDQLLIHFEALRHSVLADAHASYEAEFNQLEEEYAAAFQSRRQALLDGFDTARQEAFAKTDQIVTSLKAELDQHHQAALEAHGELLTEIDLVATTDGVEESLLQSLEQERADLETRQGDLASRLLQGHEQVSRESAEKLDALRTFLDGQTDDVSKQLSALGGQALDDSDELGAQMLHTLEEGTGQAVQQVQKRGDASLQKAQTLSDSIIIRMSDAFHLLKNALGKEAAAKVMELESRLEATRENIHGEIELRRQEHLETEAELAGEVTQREHRIDVQATQIQSTFGGFTSSSREQFAAASDRHDAFRASHLDQVVAGRSRLELTLETQLGSLQRDLGSIRQNLVDIFGQLSSQVTDREQFLLRNLGEHQDQNVEQSRERARDLIEDYLSRGNTAHSDLQEHSSTQQMSVASLEQTVRGHVTETIRLGLDHLQQEHASSESQLLSTASVLAGRLQEFNVDQLLQIREALENAKNGLNQTERAQINTTLQAREQEHLQDVLQRGYMDGEDIKEAMIQLGIAALEVYGGPVFAVLGAIPGVNASAEAILQGVLSWVDIPLQINFEPIASSDWKLT